MAEAQENFITRCPERAMFSDPRCHQVPDRDRVGKRVRPLRFSVQTCRQEKLPP
jgi:hypothetical protein